MDPSQDERNWAEAAAEDLLAERRPGRPPRSPREAALLRAMIELRAARPALPEPSEELRRRLEAALAQGRERRAEPGGERRAGRRGGRGEAGGGAPPDAPAAAWGAPGGAISRRQALRWLAAAAGAMLLAAAGLSRWLDLRGTRGEWVEAAKSGDVTEGAVVYREIAGQGIFLVRQDARLRALSATCTHMPCPLHADAGARLLRCPCHGAAFDLEGKPADGTYRLPLRPLPQFAVRESGGRILIWIG
ncbi:MAG: Rieske (2Fe-2S) protein [Firmicutes bacterium]|nr:Rieske (2Fe-2S) protein [Bacillota bacterium]